MICEKCNNKNNCGEFFKFLAKRDNDCTGFEQDEIGPSERAKESDGTRTMQDLYLEEIVEMEAVECPEAELQGRIAESNCREPSFDDSA